MSKTLTNGAKKSFFKEYFLYALSNQKGFFVASLILNIAGLPIFTTMAAIVLTPENAELGMLGAVLLSLSAYLSVGLVFAEIALTMTAPHITGKYCSDRAYTDTLGSLPLTFSQRFWGEYLAGISVHLVPLVFCGIFSIIMANVAENAAQGSAEGLAKIITIICATLFLCITAAFSISIFMNECCGKISSGLFFTALAAAAPMMIVMTFSGAAYAFTVGIEPISESARAAAAVPPIGPIIEFLSRVESGNMVFAVESFGNVLIMLLFSIIFTAGAFFAAKIRKAEQAGSDVVFETVYQIFSTLAGLAIIGIAIYSFGGEFRAEGALIAAFLLLAALFTLELIHYKNAKKIPLILLKTAAVYIVGTVFFCAAFFTEGFGVGDHVPDVSAVEKVSISGKGIPGISNAAFEYSRAQSISAAINEHKKLLENKEFLSTAKDAYIADLKIDYYLKGGGIVSRSYVTSRHGGFAKLVKSLPPEDVSGYGIISGNNYEDLYFELFNLYDDNAEFTRIRPEKSEELKKILLEDIRESYVPLGEERSKSAIISAYYKRSGLTYSNVYPVYADYKRTLEFLRDKNNYCEKGENIADDENFTVSLASQTNDAYEGEKFFGDRLAFTFESGNIPRSALELLKLCEAGSGEEYSDLIIIHGENGSALRVKKENEARAVELFYEALSELGY